MIKFHDREYFYKYMKAEIAKKTLLDLKVLLRSPLTFNDPFDSQIDIRCDVSSGEELVEKIAGITCGTLAPFLKKMTAGEATSNVSREMLKDSDFVRRSGEGLQTFYRDLNENVLGFAEKDRIFCVTEKKCDLLMWAHYADEHKGVAIKFRCVPEKRSVLCAARPVHYEEQMPVLTIERLLRGKDAAIKYILEKMLLTKSKDWEHEKEWRVILNRVNRYPEYELRNIFEEEIEAIYLGCRMSEEDKKEIIDIVRSKRNKVKLYEAHKQEGEFKLHFSSLKLSS
jgi:hypothetical protein